MSVGRTSWPQADRLGKSHRMDQRGRGAAPAPVLHWATGTITRGTANGMTLRWAWGRATRASEAAPRPETLDPTNGPGAWTLGPSEDSTGDGRTTFESGNRACSCSGLLRLRCRLRMPGSCVTFELSSGSCAAPVIPAHLGTIAAPCTGGRIPGCSRLQLLWTVCRSRYCADDHVTLLLCSRRTRQCAVPAEARVSVLGNFQAAEGLGGGRSARNRSTPRVTLPHSGSLATAERAECFRRLTQDGRRHPRASPQSRP